MSDPALQSETSADPARAALERFAARETIGNWLDTRRPPARAAVREAAVLMLFSRGHEPRTPAGEAQLAELERIGAADVGVVLLQRASSLRSHPGQVAFPGGAVDSGDATVEAAALREAWEETGVEPQAVEVLGRLEPLWVPVSGFSVTPVLGWTQTPQAVQVIDQAESSLVYQVSVADLVAPANRGTFDVPSSNYVSPVFDVGVLRAWGFTAGLLEGLLEGVGWAQDWDRTRKYDISF